MIPRPIRNGEDAVYVKFLKNIGLGCRNRKTIVEASTGNPYRQALYSTTFTVLKRKGFISVSRRAGTVLTDAGRVFLDSI